MHFRPHLVDLSQLSADRAVSPVGVGGQDPRDASAEYGRECLERSVELVRQMFLKAGLLT
jgi:creatinine amidohydrolase/Fe(II)-dependent formamide hydrolase-like protein